MDPDEIAFNIEIIDYLELFNSTIEAARLIGISQSSCSRRYRMFSERHNLRFDRRGDRYQATNNFDVLASLRQAAQKRRIHQGQPRLCLGWQLGEVELPGIDQAGKVLPIRPMDSWRLLSLLEQRLIDVALMGLLEFQTLLRKPLPHLRARRLALSPSMMCVPLVQFDLRLLAHNSHPLQGRKDLTPDDLARFPSPSLPLGMSPTLMGSLQNHSLASQACGLTEYDEQRWEGFAAHGMGLSYSSPHLLPRLNNRYQLWPLMFDLGIRECIGMVGHRDVLSDPGLPRTFLKSVNSLQAGLNKSGDGLQWLS
jgi:DNA-binding transcriptional LysR family regulator